MIWLAGTFADRLWLQLDQRLPAWDQAEYLNSAVDHGRALGLLAGGGWQGWSALLDLSPKIPPLASLVNGSVMAFSGDSPDQASWALAIWQLLLLAVVACWGRQLGGPRFGLLAAALVCLAPALAALRVDFTLDLPLTATAMLALWRLGCWYAPAPRGGRWSQALVAAAAVATAVMVKQSALLVLLLPCLWAAGTGLGQPQRRLQTLAALALVLTVALPWLKHNWITTLGGTNRAVIESGAAEGDPSPLSLASLFWYPRLFPAQLGAPMLAVGAAGGALALWQRRRPADAATGAAAEPPDQGSGPPTESGGTGSGWGWLLGCALAGWLVTSLSPNKDPRYIAPVLPLLVLLLARGWWVLLQAARARFGPWLGAVLLGVGLLGTGATTASERVGELERRAESPVPEAIEAVRQRVGTAPTTVLVIPSTAEVNQHNVSTFGRLGGGQILGRESGKQKREHALVLQQAQWLLLASGDQGTKRKESRQLSRSVRSDGRFERVGSWPWTKGRQLELWQRRAAAPAAVPFDRRFITLSRGLEQGPAGLGAVFDAIGPEHQLDGHFLYQARVRRWAEARLSANPNDREALWALALLDVLLNRPAAAEGWFKQLEAVDPANPWPSAYRSVVLLADWRPWQAATVAEAARLRHDEPVLDGLVHVAGVLGGDLRRLPGTHAAVEAAIASVEARIEAGAKEGR
ncbi:glycosyltransferase family 39 protein [Synechococcus sp. Lug-A]|uniref:glycosyltransferase family 39 protein n=1 Tax=Synechococcus sp. Lug-A TaxID=2823740 RepID=UPI0020CC7EEA|nr:glycosyltransferase family 39 protein [Synechococcus sp. Lug-A]